MVIAGELEKGMVFVGPSGNRYKVVGFWTTHFGVAMVRAKVLGYTTSYYTPSDDKHAARGVDDFDQTALDNCVLSIISKKGEQP